MTSFFAMTVINIAKRTIKYYAQSSRSLETPPRCMEVQVNQAASLYEHDKASYYTNDAEAIIVDTKIRLVFISLNMRATRSTSSRRWRRAKDIHIEKPHLMNDDQLARLCVALRANTGRIISVGFKRLRNPFGKWNREMLWTENGELMQNWFVSGHEIAPDDWSAMEEDDGRVLGNLCHWTDLTYQMMPPERRFPIRITPTRSAKSDCDVAVTYVFGNGSVGVISFCGLRAMPFKASGSAIPRIAATPRSPWTASAY
jgi:predicted dehydrogenase